MQKGHLFVDFDGVVCDSVPECLVSSYLAYREYYKGETVSSIPLELKKKFYEYRPFIRSGEDYILLHKFIEEKIPLLTQEDFDRVLRTIPAEKLDRYRELFYRARENVLREDRDYWLRINPLFPGFHGFLARTAENSRVSILSTKKPEFIREILLHHGLDWPLSRIYFPDKRSKREVIEAAAPPDTMSFFIDDQLDHLLTAAANPTIIPVIASWGYVKKEWLEQRIIRKVTREEFFADAEAFLETVS